ncbi:MAG: hypothetical protein H7288_06295 [Kineosporiaceae bacterium]|nr:hypothetical protein [Aeromicrobium sp.]
MKSAERNIELAEKYLETADGERVEFQVAAAALAAVHTDLARLKYATGLDDGDE